MLPLAHNTREDYTRAKYQPTPILLGGLTVGDYLIRCFACTSRSISYCEVYQRGHLELLETQNSLLMARWKRLSHLRRFFFFARLGSYLAVGFRRHVIS